MKHTVLHTARWARVARRYDSAIAAILFGVALVGSLKLMWLLWLIGF